MASGASSTSSAARWKARSSRATNPAGADWQIVRADGVVHLQARYTIETDTGGLILVNAEGYRHGPPEVMERLARDETVDPALYYFRTFMRFETADPASTWLNRILAIGYGARQKGAVRIEVFEVLSRLDRPLADPA